MQVARPIELYYCLFRFFFLFFLGESRHVIAVIVKGFQKIISKGKTGKTNKRAQQTNERNVRFAAAFFQLLSEAYLSALHGKEQLELWW